MSPINQGVFQLKKEVTYLSKNSDILHFMKMGLYPLDSITGSKMANYNQDRRLIWNDTGYEKASTFR
jgi:hypothetical protein